MGRWVTSKGRRIYIPDEGEENPYFDKNGKKITKEPKTKYDLGGNPIIDDEMQDILDRHEEGERLRQQEIRKKKAAKIKNAAEENRQKQNDAIRNLRSKGMGIQEASKTVSKMSTSEREKAAQEYREKSGGKTNYRDKEESTKQKQIAENKKQADERNGKKSNIKTTYLDNDISKEEQAYMNAKAIKISKNMPKEEQTRRRKLKAQYNEEYQEEKAKRLASSGGKKQYRMDAADWEVRMDDLYSKYSKKFSREPNAWLNYGEEGKAAYRLYKQAVEKVEPNKRKRAKYFRDRTEY